MKKATRVCLRIPFSVLTLLTLLLSPHCLLFAEIVYMKNGHVIEGKIVEENEESITMEIKTSKVTFARENVKTIWRGTREDLLEKKGKTVHFVKGLELYENGEFQSAAQEFEESISPDAPAARINLGSAYAASGDFAKAEKEFKRTLESDPASYEARLNLGKLYVQNEKWEPALEIFQKLYEEHPQDQAAASTLGYLYFKSKNYEKALEVYQSSYRDGDLVNLSSQALALIELGQDDKAETLLRDVLKKNSLFVKGHLYLAELLKRKGRMTQAQYEYQTAASLRPKSIPVHLLLAGFYTEQGDFVKSRKIYERILRAQPEQRETLYALAKNYEMANDLPSAIHQHEKILSKEPDYIPSLNQTGVLYLNSEQPQKALEQFQKIFKLNDQDPRAHVNAGIAYILMGDIEKAKAQWERAIQLDPGLKPALQNQQKLDSLLKDEKNAA